MFDIDNTQAQSVTATVCENAQLFGATPERDEFDPREVWDADDAMDAVSEAFRIIAEGVGPDGTQLADERESLLWGFVNTFDAQVRRLDRSVDRLSPELRDLQTSQDGTEIKSRELELVTDRAQNFGDRRDAFEKMRDLTADAYRAETGNTWRPRRGSNVSQTGKLTSAAIDARDFMRARKDRETRAHLPQGTLVAIAGGKNVTDAGAVINRLDKAKAKYADIILVHGGGPRRRAHRRAVGRTERRAPGGVQARLERSRTGRTIPAQRRAAEPPAEGRHRFPRLRHHRQPGRQSRRARHPGPARRRLSRIATTGRVASAARPFSLVGHHDRRTARLRVARRLRRRAPRRLRALPPHDLAHSPLHQRQRERLHRLATLDDNVQGTPMTLPVLGTTMVTPPMPVAVTPMPTTVQNMMLMAVPKMGTRAVSHTTRLGASLRDRATLPSPLRGLGPSGGYPSRLRSLRSLRAPACPAARYAPRRCRNDTLVPRFDRVVEVTAVSSSRLALHAALVAVLAPLALAGCAGCGHRPGLVAAALRASPVSASPFTVSRTAPCSRVRTSADCAAGATADVLRTTPCSSRCTSRRSNAAAAPTSRCRRPRFPER